MFERFTPEARDLVRRSEAHARRLGHSWVGCEHLLLSLCGAAGPAAGELRQRGAGPAEVEAAITSLVGTGSGDNDDRVALAVLGIDIDQVRTTVEATFGAGALNPTAGAGRLRRRRARLLHRRGCGPARRDQPFTARAKRCLEGALQESLRLEHRSIDVEHVALSVLAHDDTVAWQVLVHLGVDTGALRRSIEEPLRRTA